MRFTLSEAQHITEALKLHRLRLLQGLEGTKESMVQVADKQKMDSLAADKKGYEVLVHDVEQLLDKMVKWINDNLERKTREAVKQNLQAIPGEDGDPNQGPVVLVDHSNKDREIDFNHDNQTELTLVDHLDEEPEVEITDSAVKRKNVRREEYDGPPPSEESEDDEDSDPDFWNEVDDRPGVGGPVVEAIEELPDDDEPTVPVDPDAD